MNLDELKIEWQRVNEKLANTGQLNKKLIESMLQERSRSRVEKLRRAYIQLFVLMLLNLGGLTAIFIGNPFDFKYAIEYLPFCVMALGSLITIGTSIQTFHTIFADINNSSLDVFLKAIIESLEKNQEMVPWFGRIMLTTGILSPFTGFHKRLENEEFGVALAETLAVTGVLALLVFLLIKSGVFKDRFKEGFENDLKEWNELHRIADDLNDNG